MSDVSSDIQSSALLYRRVALSLVPLLLLCYIVAMIDRLNVGYAKLQFMADLHFDEAVFGMAAGSLYVGYILFEVPSNLMLERAGVRLTLLRIMTLWGVFAMAMAFAANRWGFYATRFMIGAAEAGFFPGVLFYLTLWFPSGWRARITSLFAVAVPLSGVVAAPASSWIMTHMAGVADLRGWQWLFLIEGAPAVVLGVIAYFVLPDRPANARFLSADEKARIARDLEEDADSATASGTFAQALRSPRTYVLALVYFAFYSTQSILLLVGSDPAAQLGRSRSRRNRLAHIVDLRRRGHRNGRDRMEFGPHARAPLASDELRDHRQRRILPASACRAKPQRHEPLPDGRLGDHIRLPRPVLDGADRGIRQGRARRRHRPRQFDRRLGIGVEPGVHRLDASSHRQPVRRDRGVGLRLLVEHGGAICSRAGQFFSGSVGRFAVQKCRAVNHRYVDITACFQLRYNDQIRMKLRQVCRKCVAQIMNSPPPHSITSRPRAT